MRVPKPWFRKQSGTWYVQLDGKQHNLGADKAAALDAYHKLMLARGEGATRGTYTVRNVLAAYWGWLQRSRAAATCERRQPLLRSFGESVPATMKATELRAHHVQKWVDSQPLVKSPTTVRDYIALIKGVFNWAEAMGFIDRSPIAKMPKPPAKMREEFLPAELWPKVFKAATDDEFRDYLVFMLSTGTRPEEVRKLEVRHFDGQRLIIPASEAKGRKKSRVIYLADEALEIVKRLSARYTDGLLFRNRDGEQWTNNAIRCRFRRIKRIMKMPKLTATALRHSFAHHRLTSGQDALTVSKLMGHVDTRMIATRYGHLDANTEFMQNAASQIGLPCPPTATDDQPETLPSQPA